jgi:peptidylprolyl isomerase
MTDKKVPKEAKHDTKPVNDGKVVKEGDDVQVEYEGSLENGEVFDSSAKHGDQPLHFTVGKGMVIKGFDVAVVGMKKGEEKTVSINPEEGYGPRHDKLLMKIPRDKTMEDQEPKKGMYLVLNAPDGQQYPALIADVSDVELTIDLNHPLAGKVLNFKVKIVGITSNPA